jgi:membrane fusion protein, multidrug efflux system
MANVVSFSRRPKSENEDRESQPSVKTAKSRFRFKKFLFMLPLFLAGLLAVGGYYYWEHYLQFVVQTDNAQVYSTIAPVNSRMMGFVERVLVSENDTVEENTVLAEFESSDIALEIRLKEARYKKAEVDYTRAQRLHRSGALSKSDLELGEASAALALADLDGAKLKLSFAKVRAHVAGTIGKRNLQPGQFVQPGQSLFWIIPRSNTLRVKAHLKETQIRKVKTGQKVRMRFDSNPGKDYWGTVETVLPSSGGIFSLFPPENSTGHYTKVVQTIPVYIQVEDEPNSLLFPGMSVFVEIDTREGKNL